MFFLEHLQITAKLALLLPVQFLQLCNLCIRGFAVLGLFCLRQLVLLLLRLELTLPACSFQSVVIFEHLKSLA
jgi:NADH:ubiquinone oxidoreductase subunit K